MSITISGATMPVTGSVLVEDFGGWPAYRIGDRIRATGTLEMPKPIEEFDYPHYLRLQGISSVVRRATIEASIAPSTPSYQIRLRQHLQTSKLWFLQRINRLFPEPSAALIAGLLTGDRRGFTKNTLEDFRITGLTHLIAISGTNVTIVLSVLGGLLFWLPLRWRFLPQVIALILFTLLVGASASVVRAAIMGILGLLALQCGRVADTRLAIAWTALCMAAWSPEQLWWDSGFHLSFAAVIGVTEIGPLLKKSLTRIPEAMGVRESLAMTLAAQIATLPISASTFGQISVVAPLSNTLAAPAVPIAMLLGFLGTLTSVVSFPLGQVVGFLGYGTAEWIIGVASLLAKIPYAAVQI
jgi:competence protein ComEC